MTAHDDSVRLRHMLDHAREAVALISGRSRSDFDRDRVRQLALTHLIEVVGEAASRVTPATQTLHPEVPWRPIVGMRHRLVHGYSAIDLDMLWKTLAEDVPALIRILERIGSG